MNAVAKLEDVSFARVTFSVENVGVSATAFDRVSTKISCSIRFCEHLEITTSKRYTNNVAHPCSEEETFVTARGRSVSYPVEEGES